jgi:phosphoserine aminotransferase
MATAPIPMISFYPGPSKVYPQVAQYLQDAYASGILSVNHRSAAAMALVESTFERLREKLRIPAEYGIYLTSSATECWEILAQSLTHTGSTHLHNGAFGQKWHQYAARLRPACTAQAFELQEVPPLPGPVPELLCLTHNETSNGTRLPADALTTIRRYLSAQAPDALVAIDATSSMAGVAFDWTLGDAWYASVQKCFGLPAGLALLVCSPRALERARALQERAHYNSLLFLDDNFRQFQTPYTPNVLGIYLLNRVLEHVPPIETVDAQTRQRAQDWYHFLETRTDWVPLVSNPAVRSETVIALRGTPERLAALKARCTAAGMSLGNGYGPWRETTVRIANFPAHTDAEISTLKKVLATA